ncbi:hypothetical protein WICMUC_005821 [Wickerhamomyces mucosus]|uniref:Thiamine transporter n=1 Tax=Wickerhamomyces mucosus TaxID=1378264 RepID=A0A9P8P3M2_9ASCO|nr:hypothetical protein WICMUC_005821 [Wickerhamomyces mucosus]
MSRFIGLLEVSHSTKLTILRSPDLEPIPKSARTWNWIDNFSYWSLISFSIGTWISGSALLPLGLSISETIGALLLGDLISLIYTVINSFTGVNYGIGYTLQQRIVFGVFGSSLGLGIRILLSIVNYGSNAWLGGMCISLLISSLSKNFMNWNTEVKGILARDVIGFVIFLSISLAGSWIRPQKLKSFMVWSCVVSFFSMLGLLIYLVKNSARVIDFNYTENTHFDTKGWTWVYIITYWFSAVSPMTLNQSDYARFSSSSIQLCIGTTLALMIPTIVIPIFGIIGAFACKDLFGEELWLPIDIVYNILQNNYNAKARAATFFMGFSFAFCQLCLNLITSFAGGMDLSGVLPKFIDIKRGSIIVLLLSIVVQPWKFYYSSSVFLTVMTSFGIVATPMIAVLVCDYFVVRGRKYNIPDAFIIKGDYFYHQGINYRAMLAFVCGLAPGIPGLIWQVNGTDMAIGILRFYYGDSFFGFFISFGVYWALCILWPPKPTEGIIYYAEDNEASSSLEKNTPGQAISVV